MPSPTFRRNVRPLSKNVMKMAIPVLALLATPDAEAANLFWDSDGAGAAGSVGSPAGVGGTGTWDTISSLWYNYDISGYQVWANTGGVHTASLFSPNANAKTVTIASGTTINVNRIVVGAGGYTVAAGNASSVLNFDGTSPTIAQGSNGLTINANITGGEVNKTGTGSLTLNGNNTFDGFRSTTNDTFVLTLGTDTALGAGAVTISGGAEVTFRSINNRVFANTFNVGKNAVVFGTSSGGFLGDLTFGDWKGGQQGLTVNNSRTTLASYTASAGTITKAGTGHLVVAGNWTQSGSTVLTISNGALAVGGVYSNVVAANLGSTGTTVTTGLLGRNGTISANLNAANGVKWTGGANASDGGLFAYGSSATWGSADNNLVVNIGGGTPLIWGSTAGFIAGGRTLHLGHALSNGTVDFRNALNLNGAVRTVQVNKGDSNTDGGADAVFSGVISNGGLTKTGDGTLRLTAINTYVGDTVVNGGVLHLADDAQLAFVIGGSGVNNAISGNGALLLAGDFTFDLSVAAGVGSWTIVDAGILTRTTFGSTFAVVGFSEVSAGVWQSGDYAFAEGTGVLTVIPEPSALSILGAGVMGLLVRQRRRNT